MNIGNYESARVDVSMRAQVESGEDFENVYIALDELVIEALSQEVDSIKGNKKVENVARFV